MSPEKQGRAAWHNCNSGEWRVGCGMCDASQCPARHIAIPPLLGPLSLVSPPPTPPPLTSQCAARHIATSCSPSPPSPPLPFCNVPRGTLRFVPRNPAVSHSGPPPTPNAPHH